MLTHGGVTASDATLVTLSIDLVIFGSSTVIFRKKSLKKYLMNPSDTYKITKNLESTYWQDLLFKLL